MPQTDAMPGGDAPTRRPFTNRHDLIGAFDDALSSVTPETYHVLNFHGVGGIGKSSLLDYLADTRGSAPSVIAAAHDLGVDADARDPGYALAAIRAAFGRAAAEKGERLLFPTFDLAFAHYWSLRAPHLSLKDAKAPFLDEGGALFDLLSATGVPLVGLLKALPKAVDRLSQQARDWWTATGERDLARVQYLRTFTEVEPLLRMFLATDLRAWAAGHPDRRVVLLLDTHEAFSETPTSGVMRDEPDRWLRDLAGHLKGIVLVVAGRGALDWETRDADWADLLRVACVDDFEPRYIEEYLQACRIAEPDVRAAIATRSRGVPLYLDVAVTTYERIRNAEARPPHPDEFDASLSDLFERFLCYSDREERAAFEVLSVPETFDRERFEDLMRSFATGYPATTNGLRALCAFDFVREPEPGRFAFHALVREAIAAHHAPEDRTRVHRHLLTRAEETLDNVTNLTIRAEHRLALQEGVEHARQVLETKALFDWYWRTEHPFFDAADWALLEPLYFDMLALATAALGPHHPDTLLCVNNLAYILNALGDLDTAEILFRCLLEDFEAGLGPDHHITLAAVNNLASVLKARGDLDAAEPLYRRALSTSEATLGLDHTITLTSVNNLGYLLNARGDLDAAELLFRRSFTGNEARFGPDHRDTLTSVSNLASLLSARGDLDEAEPLLRRVLATRKTTLRLDHPDTLTSVNNLASLLVARGDLDAAEPLLWRALTTRETTLGLDHPDTLASVNNLGYLLVTRGDLDAAEPLYRRALAGHESKLGPDHPSTLASANNLSYLLQKRDNLDAAE